MEPAGRGIAAGRAIEDQNLAAAEPAARHDQKIVDGIDADGGLVTQRQLGIRASQNSLGRDIPVGQAVKHQNVLIGAGEQDFVVHGVDGQLGGGARADIDIRIGYRADFGSDLRFVSLDDAKRRFLSAGRAAEGQNRLRQRAGDHDFIVNAVKGDVMHGPAEEGFLTFD